MYYEGQGVPQDYMQAYLWSNLAGSGGLTAAIAYRDLAAARMTPEQIAEAQRLAREWKAKIP
jgi:TPR repeat protein